MKRERRRGREGEGDREKELGSNGQGRMQDKEIKSSVTVPTHWFQNPFLSSVAFLPLPLQQTQVMREDKGQWDEVKVL